ncbi:LexA family protein [Marinagarivorans cellulosilyticus]|uniref:DNA polymerase V n=1 Tax=Marinagarivorans cellulosilyticus TaxID=2721545 RepID=A0AAN1WHI7_9GAMM|nr:translesion error-prone DNA polymerase V autoproteolytic subunit [Marinagarivorans cellulosilyticus]BCD97706.1 DNA polymerase V [Marinagarivorans cellulosilyticus]
MIIQPLNINTIESSFTLPLALTRLRCGFPSPADDHLDAPLDLIEHLIQHPAATYFARAEGDSMSGVGIMDGDLLIVDRSITPKHKDIVVAAVDGQLTCKILDTAQHQLLSANNAYPPIHIDTEHADLIIEGVVIHAIHHLRNQ